MRMLGVGAVVERERGRECKREEYCAKRRAEPVPNPSRKNFATLPTLYVVFQMGKRKTNREWRERKAGRAIVESGLGSKPIALPKYTYHLSIACRPLRAALGSGPWRSFVWFVYACSKINQH